MKIKRKLNAEAFAAVMEQAVLLFGLTEEEIRARLPERTITLSDFYDGGEKNCFLDINFEEEELGLTYMLDDDRKSFLCVVFPEKEYEIAEYIGLFNSLYSYDYVRCKWILPCGGILGLDTMRRGRCFVIDM